MKNTCCVPHCESKRRNFKLHCFPKTEIGLKWVEKINCEKLKQLSAEELHKFFVCHKHFEARFVTGSLRLRHFAYPTLFTADEINTGIPALEMENYENQNVFYDHDYTQARKRHHEDHSYFKTQPLKSQDYNEPPSIYKHFKMTEKIAVCLHHDKTANMPSTSKDFEKTACDQNNQQPIIPDLPQCSNVVTSKKCIRKNTTRNKKFSPSYLRILNELKKAKKQLSFAKRAKRAMKFSKKENFEKLTCNLKPLAKKIIWMQIMQSGKHSKGWRFSDEEKMIALAIMKQSPKSYRFLRRIFILPSIRTINKLINKLKMDSGINPHIFKAIKTEVVNWQESKKYCSLIFDEVSIEPGLTYDKYNDNICGLVELLSKTCDYADHALVFLIRGAVHKWQQPIAFYFCKGTTPALILKNIIEQVTEEIIKTGLIPVALISDQGTSFQSAINKLKEDTRKKQILAKENTDDTIIIRGQKINVIFDPPHLIKGLRNNFLDKNILLNGKTSKWNDIVDVYLTDCKHAEMRLLHKLNDEHVIPQKIKKMKVKNCSRVLSKTVAGALAYTSQFSHYADGKAVSSTLKNTSEVVSFFDDLFDSCNGAALTRKNKGKPLRQAVTNSSEHEIFWKNSIKKLEGMRFINKEGKECIVPSQKNYVVTLKSLTRLWRFFKEKGLKIMRPRYFNSDPIENFFGQMRAYSFRSNDPNCQAFKNIFRSLLVTRFINFHSENYNCEETSGEQIIKLKKLLEAPQVCETQMPLSSSNVIISPEDMKNIQVEARKERLSVHSRAYTAGWVVKKCLKIIKCNNCKNCLTQNNESSVHQWISHREYRNLKKKQKLTYPSEYAVRYFSNIVKETNEYLELKPNSYEISKKIAHKIKSKYSFDFLTCRSHKQALLEYFVSITIKLCIWNWCNIVNKILKGLDIVRLKLHKQLPHMQDKAYKKFQKKLKNKNLNK